jgi:hypothetical protein
MEGGEQQKKIPAARVGADALCVPGIPLRGQVTAVSTSRGAACIHGVDDKYGASSDDAGFEPIPH